MYIKNVLKLILITSFCVICCLSCGNKIPEFDGQIAYQYLQKQCDFGSRNPGSDGHQLCKNYLLNFFKKTNSEVESQDFTVEIRGEEYHCTNIIASFYPRKSTRILIGAHWDSRPWADSDSIAENHNKPILGANDGASGVAILMHLADILNKYEPYIFGVDLVLFDVEDAGTTGRNDDWCLGSKYFVDNFSKQKPKYVIIVDMIGDKDLNVNIEKFSYDSAPDLVATIWKIAKQKGFDNFKTSIEFSIYDDHFPFIEKGFSAIDIIDIDYPYWHTLADTPDKCSPESLHIIGTVLTEFIFNKKWYNE